jgi:hypothetical protein
MPPPCIPKAPRVHPTRNRDHLAQERAADPGLDAYFRALEHYPRISDAEVQCLARHIHAGDRSTRAAWRPQHERGRAPGENEISRRRLSHNIGDTFRLHWFPLLDW